MNNWIFIAIGSGLAAAALHGTVLSGSPTSMILFNLAPLPLFLAGLGWGPVAAAAAGVVGCLALTAAIGLKPGLFFIISTAIAPVVLSHLALINRPAGAASEGEAAHRDVEWYPEGRLILWCALIACGLMTITILVIGGGAEGFQAAVDLGLERLLARVAEGVTATELAQIRQVVAIMSQFAAQITASVWLLATLFNFWIASRILTASSRSPRPWAAFGSYALPRTTLVVLAIACLAVLLPGTLGLIGGVGLALMTTTLAIIGLAALHGLTMGNPMRTFILSTVYLILLVFSWIIVVPLVLLALADLIFELRNKRAAIVARDDE